MRQPANKDLLFQGLQHYGITEVKGSRSNNIILRLIRRLVPKAKDDTEVAWCSAWMDEIAVNVCAERTGNPAARSWLTVGEEVINPHPGDVVVFWRKSVGSWQGHVALYICQIGGVIFCLGGNQGNAVNISGYKANRLLGYRRLRLLSEE
jgi:uncharacterized protein (TIGR02594 family)